jgi:hypothetical protein
LFAGFVDAAGHNVLILFIGRKLRLGDSQLVSREKAGISIILIFYRCFESHCRLLTPETSSSWCVVVQGHVGGGATF